MKRMNREQVIQILNDALVLATEQGADERVGGEILSYRTHLEMFYKPTDMILLHETFYNMLVRINGLEKSS